MYCMDGLNQQHTLQNHWEFWLVKLLMESFFFSFLFFVFFFSLKKISLACPWIWLAVTDRLWTLVYSTSSPSLIVIVFSVVLSLIDKSFLCLEVYWALFIPTVNRIVKHEGLHTYTLRQGMRISGPSWKSSSDFCVVYEERTVGG